jgi:hypothetical protein
MTTRFLKVLLLLGFSLTPPTLARGADATGWRLIHLDGLAASWDHYLQPTFNPYFPQQMNDGLAVNIDSTVAKFFLWNSEVHGIADTGQYRYVSLYMEFGVRLSRYADLSVWHKSEHLLDTTDAYDRHFSVANSVQLKIYFFRSDSKPSLF